MHRPRLTGDEWFALATVGGGLVTAFGLYLAGTGRQKDAAMIGVAVTVTGAFVAGARLLGDNPEVLIDIFD